MLLLVLTAATAGEQGKVDSWARAGVSTEDRRLARETAQLPELGGDAGGHGVATSI
jgi:hypothetical protein